MSRCRTCKFYNGRTCHRNPPQLPGFYFVGGNPSYQQGCFPIVDPSDWCGEYSEKAIDQ